MNNYDSPILNGQKFNITIDTKTNNVYFKQQIFSGAAEFMTIKNSSFTNKLKNRRGFFNMINKLKRIDDVQKNIIGILPF